MRRRDFVWTGTLAALSACAKKPAGGLTAIEFAVGPYPTSAIVYLAVERGYFRDAGFDVHPRVVSGGAQMSAAVAEGRVDAALHYAAPSLFNAVTRGARVRLVMGREVVTSSCGDAAAIYTRNKAFPNGTSDIRQWEGKRFATSTRASMGEFFLDTILARAGLDPKKTPRTYLEHAPAVAAMISGRLDALLNGTSLPIAVDGHPEIGREDAGARAIEPLQYSYICFGSRLLGTGTAMGARLLAAYLRASKDFLAGVTPQFLKDYAASSGLNAGALEGCRTTFTADGTLDMKSLKIALDWGIARGLTDANATAESLADQRCLELARREAV